MQLIRRITVVIISLSVLALESVAQVSVAKGEITFAGVDINHPHTVVEMDSILGSSYKKIDYIGKNSAGIAFEGGISYLKEGVEIGVSFDGFVNYANIEISGVPFCIAHLCFYVGDSEDSFNRNIEKIKGLTSHDSERN